MSVTLTRSSSLSSYEINQNGITRQNQDKRSSSCASLGKLFMPSASTPIIIPPKNQHAIYFSKLDKSTIDHLNFVDFRCLKKTTNLKVMASLKDGKLQLITGKSKGLLRELLHQAKNLVGKANTHRFEGDAPFILSDGAEIKADRLFISRQGKLVIREAKVKDNSNDGGNERKYYDVDIEPELSTVELINNEILDKTQDVNQRGNCRGTESGLMFRIKMNLREVKNPEVGIPDIKLIPRIHLNDGEEVKDIKTCGDNYQIAISNKNGDAKRVLYTIPALRGEPEDKLFSHLVDTPPVSVLERGQTHFISRNPYEGKKISHIGHRVFVLSNFIDNAVKRFRSGKTKWIKGQKFSGIGSFTKIIDPGLSAAYRVMRRLKPSHFNEQEIKELKHHIEATGKKYTALLNFHSLPLEDSQKQSFLIEQLNRAMVGTIEPSIETVDTRQLGENIDSNLKQCSLLIKYIYGATLANATSKENKHEKNAEESLTINRVLTLLESLANQFPDKIKQLNEFENLRQSLSALASRNIANFHEFDVFLSFVAEQIMNTGVYLSNISIHNFSQHEYNAADAQRISTRQQIIRDRRLAALSYKLSRDKGDVLSRAVCFGCPSTKSYRNLLMNWADLQQDSKTFSKLFDVQPNDEVTKTLSARGHSLSRYLAETVSNLPQDCSLTLSSSSRLAGFAGVAKFGIPFTHGYFAGLVAGIEKDYSLSFRTEKAGETIVELKRNRNLDAAAIGGTGGGLEQPILQHAKGGVLTVVPFEAAIVLAYSFAKGTMHKLKIINGEGNKNIEEVLSHFFEPETAHSWEQSLDDYLEGKGEYSENAKQVLEMALEIKSEFRFQAAGVSQPGFTYYRHSGGIKGKLGGALVSEENKKVGGDGVREKSRLFRLNAQVSGPLVNSLEHIILGEEYGGPAPTAKGEGEEKASKKSYNFATWQYSSNSIDKKLCELSKQIADPTIQVDVKAELMKKNEKITALIDLINQLTSNPNLSLKSTQAMQIIDKLIAGYIDQGIKVEKWKNVEKLGDVYVAQKQKNSAFERKSGDLVKFREKLSDDKLTLDKVLKLFGKKSAREILKSIKSSAQSQSNLENLGESSQLKAKITYEIDAACINSLVDELVAGLQQDLIAQNTVNALTRIKKIGSLLDRSNANSESKRFFRTASIDLYRSSEVKDKLTSTLPFIDINDYVQFTKEEKIGSFVLSYKSNSVLPISIKLNLRSDAQTTPANYLSLQSS